MSEEMEIKAAEEAVHGYENEENNSLHEKDVGMTAVSSGAAESTLLSGDEEERPAFEDLISISSDT